MAYWTHYKHKPPTDWHYNKNLDVFQKVNDRVYVYVSRLFGGYMVQLYQRGAVSQNPFCVCEARVSEYSKEKFDYMFNLGEQWLNSYSDGDEKKINEHCDFALGNQNGVWGAEKIDKKLYWL